MVGEGGMPSAKREKILPSTPLIDTEGWGVVLLVPVNLRTRR